MQDLVNVEAIPYDVMKSGHRLAVGEYGQYLDAVDRGGLGINVAGLVAFTPLRHYVMGEARSSGPPPARDRRHAPPAPRSDGGRAFGSAPPLPQHVGYQGRPLACRTPAARSWSAWCGASTTWGAGRSR